MINIKCPVGVCLVRNEKNKIIGRKSQYLFKSVFIARTKQKMPIIDKIEA